MPVSPRGVTPSENKSCPVSPSSSEIPLKDSKPFHPNPQFDPKSHPSSDLHYPLLGTGRPYNYFTPFILTEADKTEPLLCAFNHSKPGSERDEALKRLMGSVGEEVMVIPPIFVEWGKHTVLGDGVYIGTGVNIQDTGGGMSFFTVPGIPIETVSKTHTLNPKSVYNTVNPRADPTVIIGPNAMIGPSCTLATVSHPLNPRLRGPHSPELSRPIKIGANAWLGANVTVLGGVEIGEGTVIGAGAVLTKSTGPGELWVGVPARKIREGLDGEGGEDGIDWGAVPPM